LNRCTWDIFNFDKRSKNGAPGRTGLTHLHSSATILVLLPVFRLLTSVNSEPKPPQHRILRPRRTDGVVEEIRAEITRGACPHQLDPVAETGTEIERGKEKETVTVIVIVIATLETTETGGVAMITEVIEIRTMMTVVEFEEMLKTTIRGNTTTTGQPKTIVISGEDTTEILSIQMHYILPQVRKKQFTMHGDYHITACINHVLSFRPCAALFG
jgi:hypothetical protein